MIKEKKRTPTQQQQDEVDKIVSQVKEWAKEHPTGNIINLSTSPKLKKALDDRFLENWDSKKKRRIYMNYNGFMSFVYRFITKDHCIPITEGNGFMMHKLADHLFPDDVKLTSEEYDSFYKIFLPLLDYLTANYRLGTSLADHVRDFKGEKVQRDGLFATDPTLCPRLLELLESIFSLDFEAFKKWAFVSWDLACWMTCNVKHTFSYDLILCDLPSCYTPLQASLVDSMKAQNPSSTVICLSTYTNKRVKS